MLMERYIDRTKNIYRSIRLVSVHICAISADLYVFPANFNPVYLPTMTRHTS